MILCKHYTIVHYLKKLDERKEIYIMLKPNIKHLIETKCIKPLGHLSVKYYEEEIVREYSYENLKKKEFKFDLKLNDESIVKQGSKLNFYLEITPIPIEDEKSN